MIASRAEKMENAPLFASAARTRLGSRTGHVALEDVLFEPGVRKGFAPVATDADHAAVEFGVNGEKRDVRALTSHEKYRDACKAWKSDLGGALMRLEVPRQKASAVPEKDESFRDKLNMEKVALLKPVFGNPAVAAGNMGGFESGVSALVIMSRKKAQSPGLKPLGTIETCDGSTGTPGYMVGCPAKTIEKMFTRTGREIGDMSLAGINEAFAAVTRVFFKIPSGAIRQSGRPFRLTQTSTAGPSPAVVPWLQALHGSW